MLPVPDAPRILLIRRDNIGDLVCTTPLFDALRERHPRAHLAALVNSYNAPVLAGNPALDAVHVYTKAKHRPAGTSRLAVYWQTLQLIRRLRRQRFDFAIPVGGGYHRQAIKFARLAGARQVIGFVPEQGGLPGIDIGIPYHRREARHEVEDIFRLLEPLGVAGPPGPLRVYAEAEARRAAQQVLAPLAGRVLLGVHVSAREPARRWAPQAFISALRTACARHPRLGLVLLWAPGSVDDPRHPGDDAMARELIEGLAGLPLVPLPTPGLPVLIGALACCDVVLCSDGGALHLAVGLGKPVVSLFENRPEKYTRWYPWQVPYRLVRPTGRDIAGIAIDEVSTALDEMLAPLMP
ncbi:glycosyltransferase family 9 protein [Chitiniphilus purpureus]|uniref:Glycosyltransferase family 9 protein n=1 Tax=Chitiniphilus purpureus TaxID=2981137 RepID=A0ABY6DMI6_9NEIS|nr:glycosyltransferase family 9 protein [Chitiniphilus sp. CD1]UXY15567.1 glycosyltransferase family 9 protein [Chitiniphilus sp. CD1]